MRSKINILITRPAERLDDAINVLDESRFRVLPCPTVSLADVKRNPCLDKIFREVASFEFIVFTSQHAVSATMAYLDILDVRPVLLNNSCVCAVGPVTARELARHNVNTAVVPNEYTAQALAALFPPMRTYSPRVLFLKGNMATTLIADELAIKGYKVTSAVVYENHYNSELPRDATEVLLEGCARCMAFTSPSSVFALKRILGDAPFLSLLKNTVIAAIGPVTSGAFNTTGLSVTVQPQRYTLAALTSAIADHFIGE